MFVKFHERLKDSEKGFTLIELLVVILIIAILAAIAIPVFLNQRKKGWRAQVQSALKNMATAEESWLTSNPAYTTLLPDLVNEGFTFAASEVNPSVVSATGTAYCLRVDSLRDATIFEFYSSAVGRPSTTACV